MTVQEALDIYRRSILDAEANINYQIQRINVNNITAMAYFGIVGSKSAR